MKNLKPIGLENQLEDLLYGQPEDQKAMIFDKIKQTAENIDRVKKINGSPVFDPVIDGEYIRYNLSETSEKIKRLFPTTKERTHYYPIQYAFIEFE